MAEVNVVPVVVPSHFASSFIPHGQRLRFSWEMLWEATLLAKWDRWLPCCRRSLVPQETSICDRPGYTTDLASWVGDSGLS